MNLKTNRQAEDVFAIWGMYSQFGGGEGHTGVEQVMQDDGGRRAERFLCQKRRCCTYPGLGWCGVLS